MNQACAVWVVREAHLPATDWHVCYSPCLVKAHMALELEPRQVFNDLPTDGSAHVLSEPQSLMIALPCDQSRPALHVTACRHTLQVACLQHFILLWSLKAFLCSANLASTLAISSVTTSTLRLGQ